VRCFEVDFGDNAINARKRHLNRFCFKTLVFYRFRNSNGNLGHF